MKSTREYYEEKAERGREQDERYKHIMIGRYPDHDSWWFYQTVKRHGFERAMNLRMSQHVEAEYGSDYADSYEYVIEFQEEWQRAKHASDGDVYAEYRTRALGLRQHIVTRVRTELEWDPDNENLQRQLRDAEEKERQARLLLHAASPMAFLKRYREEKELEDCLNHDETLQLFNFDDIE